MSDPYNQYNQQYNQYPPNQYGSPAPGQGYPPPQNYQQPGYPPQPPHGASSGYYGDQQNQNQYQQGYGPPAAGGFEHGQSQQPPVPYGSDPYNNYQQPPQGFNHQQQYPGAPPNQQFPQQGAYPQDQYPQGHAPNPYSQPGAPQQSHGPTDPNNQAEGDRGLLGALGGGAAGYFGGNKAGGHGLVGALAGAFMGSKLEDKMKKPKHDKHSGGW